MKKAYQITFLLIKIRRKRRKIQRSKNAVGPKTGPLREEYF
jgi:hypothetical protein